MNDLVVYEHPEIFQQIEETVDLQTAITILCKVELLETALKQAKVFKENSVYYAKLHAQALLKVVDLGGDNQLPRNGYTKKAAMWLYDMVDSEREKYISMCADGLSIEQVYKREVADVEKAERKNNRLDDLREKVLDECAHKGVVSLDDYKNSVAEVLNDRSLEFDVIDGTRGALRKMGAVGVDPTSNVYVMPTPDNEYYVKRAILTRIKSVYHDILNICALTQRASVKVPFSEVYEVVQDGWDNHLHYFDRNMKGTAFGSLEGGQSYIRFFMFMLADIGVFEDEKEFYADYVVSEPGILEESSKDSVIRSKAYTYDRLMNYAKQEMRKAMESPQK